MQRSEIVLKKFGLLDRDFDLKPFLLSLLKEQIEAYYDSKTKTVNMLDWVSVDEQKPVLAHELTHALQDQHVDLDKWSDQTPPDVSLNSGDDTVHLAKDELDTAREAVTEGQATAVMMDNILKPMGNSLIKDPEVVDLIKQQMAGSGDSPVLARAPLLLSESLMFPYREGLSFEQDVWMDQGQAAAFAGALDRPPTSTWEIINPREYEKGTRPRRCRCCPTFIRWSTSSTGPTTLARWASWTCTFSPESSAEKPPRAISPRPGMAVSIGPGSCATPPPPNRHHEIHCVALSLGVEKQCVRAGLCNPLRI